jgi:hypothetical protein
VARAEIVQVDDTLGRLLATFAHERLPGGPAPSEELLAGRIAGLTAARCAGDDVAYDESLIRIASAACLIHRDRQLRRAA